jgi:uncharacterized protein YoxC
MTVSWNGAALMIIAVVFVVFVVYFIWLTRRIHQTVTRLDETLSAGKVAIETVVSQAGPVLSGLTALEKAAEEAVRDVQTRLPLVERELVPLLNELRAAAEAYRSLGRSVEQRFEREIPVLMERTQQISRDVAGLTGDIRDKVQKTEDFFEAARDTGRTVRVVTDLVGTGLTGLAVQIAGMATGLRTSLEFLSENLAKREGGKK